MRKSRVLGVFVLLLVAGVAAQGTILAGDAVCLFKEAEDFQPTEGQWKVGDWGTNYYAASMAITFLSRQQYLGVPEQCERSVAVAELDVPVADTYLVLCRYESCWFYQTQFRIQIEQEGEVLFDRLYGGIDNQKVLAFSANYVDSEEWPPPGCWWEVSKLPLRMARSQPGEETAWEGTDYRVELQPGKARIRLIAGRQPEPSARRIVDCIVLTNNEEDIRHRMRNERYLPLDGLCTREGDLFLKVRSETASSAPILVQVDTPRELQEKSPMGVHIRHWQPKLIGARGEGADETRDADWIQPGQQSAQWTEVGSLVDSLADASLRLDVKCKAPPEAADAPLLYTLIFATPEEDGSLRTIREVRHDGGPGANKYTVVGIWGNLNEGYEIQTPEEMVADIVDRVMEFPKKGKLPELIDFYGNANEPGAHEILDALGFKYKLPDSKRFVHYAPYTPEGVRDACQKWLQDGIGDKIFVVSHGDEVWASPVRPDPIRFRQFLQQRGLKPSDVVPGAENWDDINPVQQQGGHMYESGFWHVEKDQPRLYYYSCLFGGMEGRRSYFGTRTDVVKQYLPHARTGANYGPHPHYWPKVYGLIAPLREQVLTLAWGEDWLFQIPTTSPQVFGYWLDAYRCAADYHDSPIIMWLMPFWGNTPSGIRRCFYTDVGRGVTNFVIPGLNAAPLEYSEGYTRGRRNIGHYRAVHDILREAGLFEDIIYHGKVRKGEVAMLLSESSEMWYTTPLFNAEKQHVWMALKGQQYQVDFLIEDDIEEGALDGYKVLYICDPCVRTEASKVVADWVGRGGRLFATAGAAMQNEFDQPNEVLKALFAVEPDELRLKRHVPLFAGKDLIPLEEPMDTVRVSDPDSGKAAELPVLFVKQDLKLTRPESEYKWTAKFSSGAPAAVSRQVGRGSAACAGFFVGTAYVKPGLSRRPPDRAGRDDAYVHFIPTEFDAAAARIILEPARSAEVERPIETSVPLVEVSRIESDAGIAVILINYAKGRIENLEVRVKDPGAITSVTLATEQDVKWRRDGEDVCVTMPLDVADAVILRR